MEYRIKYVPIVRIIKSNGSHLIQTIFELEYMLPVLFFKVNYILVK